MRIFIVTATNTQRDEVLKTMPGARMFAFHNAMLELVAFRDNEDMIMVSSAHVASQGFRLPKDTMVLLGPGIEGDMLLKIKHRTWEIDFDEPYDPETDRAIFRFDAHSKKSFEEIERFDIRDQTKVNNHWVVILRSGEKVRYLKGACYAQPDLHQSEIKA